MTLPLFLLAAAAVSLHSQDPAPVSQGSAAELEGLLARAAEYCDRLHRSVLNFVCREKVEEWFRPNAQPVVNTVGRARGRLRRIYLGAREGHRLDYDFQLIRGRDGFIQESRTLLREDGREVRVPDAPLKIHTFWHTKVVMGPLGLLSRQNQAYHDYRIVGREKSRGEEILLIEAAPKPGVGLQHLFGTVWIRKRDAGILKIEWNPASIDNYQKVEETAKFLGLNPYLLITSEYAFEKNGIRFPSRHRLKEMYRRGTSGATYQISEIIAVYEDYKFFTVETDVKY